VVNLCDNPPRFDDILRAIAAIDRRGFANCDTSRRISASYILSFCEYLFGFIFLEYKTLLLSCLNLQTEFKQAEKFKNARALSFPAYFILCNAIREIRHGAMFERTRGAATPNDLDFSRDYFIPRPILFS